MHKAFILLGGNVGNRKHFISKAKKYIQAKTGNIVLESSIYKTAAWGNTKQQSFLNQVILLHTPLSPDDLMDELLAIEIQLGRVRTTKNAPRTIDLDILFYDQLVYRSKKVILPHPLVQERRFVLIPLTELSPRKKHPVYQKTVTALLKECPDTLSVEKT